MTLEFDPVKDDVDAARSSRTFVRAVSVLFVICSLYFLIEAGRLSSTEMGWRGLTLLTLTMIGYEAVSHLTRITEILASIDRRLRDDEKKP